MASQLEKLKQLSDEDFYASVNFYNELFAFIQGNMLLKHHKMTPKLICDISNYDDYDNAVMAYNLAVLEGLLRHKPE